MLFILILGFIVLLFFYLKFKYFTLRGPLPGIPPHFLFGNLIQIGVFRDEPFPDIYKNLKKRFGDHFQVWFGPWRFVVVSNIADVQHIFTHRNIYDQGDVFCEQFSVMLPDGLICIKGYYPLFRKNQCTYLGNTLSDEKLLK